MQNKLSKSIKSGVTKITKRYSNAILNSYFDDYFDVIYLDAAHDYKSAVKNVEQCKKKVDHDGSLIFNDYAIDDLMEGIPYGVIPVVDELCVSENWEMIYLALGPMMYCNVALREIRD